MSDEIHLISAEVDMPHMLAWAQKRAIYRGLDAVDYGYALHKILTETFGDQAPRPFRIRGARGAPRASLYGYCRAPAETLVQLSREFAMPEQQLALPPSAIRSKPMPTRFAKGRELSFEILVRPSIRYRNGKELDLYQDPRKRRPTRGGKTLTREKVYLEWMRKKLRIAGAELTGAKLAAFRASRAVREAKRGALSGVDAVIWGDIKVICEDKLESAITTGIGRHKAYGYGMLLLRPKSGRPY